MHRKNSKEYQLRPKGRANIFERFNVEEEELIEDYSFHDEYHNQELRPKRRRNKKKTET